MATWPPGKGPRIGYCTGCGYPVYKEMSDRVSKSAHCQRCGLEYGNRQLEPLSWKTHQPVLDDREKLRKLIDDTYNKLVAKRHTPKMPLKAFVTVIDHLSWATDKTHVRVVRVKDLTEWGYVIEGDTIRRKLNADNIRDTPEIRPNTNDSCNRH